MNFCGLIKYTIFRAEAATLPILINHFSENIRLCHLKRVNFRKKLSKIHKRSYLECDYKVACNNFALLARESNNGFLEIKESFFIKGDNPSLNKIFTIRNYLYFLFENSVTEI